MTCFEVYNVIVLAVLFAVAVVVADVAAAAVVVVVAVVVAAAAAAAVVDVVAVGDVVELRVVSTHEPRTKAPNFQIPSTNSYPYLILKPIAIKLEGKKRYKKIVQHKVVWYSLLVNRSQNAV